MKPIRKLLALGLVLALCLCCLPVAAAAAEGTLGDAISWQLDGDGVLTVSGSGGIPSCHSEPAPWQAYSNTVCKVILEEGITEIGACAFQDLPFLREISLPNTLTAIGSYAFSDCGSLTGITVPANVTSLGDSPFGACVNLEKILVDGENPAFSSFDGLLYTKDQTQLLEFPSGKSGTVSIPAAAANAYVANLFLYCPRLTAFSVDPENPHFSSQDGILYSKDRTKLLRCPGARTGTVTVPEGVTVLDEYAFMDCAGVTAVLLPDSLEEIRFSAFGRCTGLMLLTVPQKVSAVGMYAFQSSGLDTVYFLGSAPEIGSYAFHNVTAQICYPAEDTTWTADSLQHYGGKLSWNASAPISGTCGEFATWTYENGILTVGGTGPMDDFGMDPENQQWRYAPWEEWIPQITGVVIEEGVTGIGSGAFESAPICTPVRIPASVTEIGENAFFLCGSIPAFQVEADNPSYCSIDGILYNRAATELILCPGGKGGSVEIPETVTVIRPYAFFLCMGVTEISIPAGVTSVGKNAFSFCDSLKTVVFQGSAPSVIAADAFAGVTAQLQYPGQDPSWTQELRQNYGGSLTWVPAPSSHIPGDINGDGQVNNKDLTRLFQHLSGYEVAVVETALDVNGDSRINNKDLTRLFQYLSGYDVDIF